VLHDVGRSEPTRVDEELGPLGQHAARRQGDVGAGRRVDVRPEQMRGGEVAVGGVRRQHGGEQLQAFGRVDGVLEPDDQVMGEPHEGRAAQLTAGESRRAGAGCGVGERKGHSPAASAGGRPGGAPPQKLWTTAAAVDGD
jgi:hypothetical protein